jgi:hypothetical protein
MEVTDSSTKLHGVTSQKAIKFTVTAGTTQMLRGLRLQCAAMFNYPALWMETRVSEQLFHLHRQGKVVQETQGPQPR